MTKRLAETQAKSNPEVLRYYCLRASEKDYTARMLKQLNQELSPFKDDATRDSQFVKEMLGHYKMTEEFQKATTSKQILKNDKKVHHYLKEMESG